MASRKTKDKNSLIKLVKDLNKRMESFEDSVLELKSMKDSVVELNEQVENQESENLEILKKLKDELRENKLKTLNETAHSMGKVIISQEDLQEYQKEVLRWKEECNRIKSSVQKEIKEEVDRQLERQLKILELQYENKTARLTAACESYQNEVANLKETITRMSSELDSQKKLTADVARVRTEISSVNK